MQEKIFWGMIYVCTGSEKMKDIYKLARKHKKNWVLDQI